MKVGVVVFRVGLDASANFRQITVDDPVAADLTGKTTLPSDPLAVDVKVTFKLGTVSLDTRL
jgi:hypothetical protein